MPARRDSYELEIDPQHLAWARFTPAQRWEASDTLWALYLSLRVSSESEPDPQSPFYDPEAPLRSSGGVKTRRHGPKKRKKK